MSRDTESERESVVLKQGLGKTLAIIPAKEGSRRLPGKNIKPLAGKNLLERSISAANEAEVFDRIFVSTESEKVAAIARAAGIDVPFMRPLDLASDPAGVVDVSLHVLDEFEKRGETFQTLVILLPTSPFRTVGDIHGALKCYTDKKVDFLHSVVAEAHSPLSSLIFLDGLLAPLHPEWIERTGAKATDEAPYLVRANGAVSIVNVARFRLEKTYYAYPLAAYEMPWERSMDVDTPLDFTWAEFVAKNVLGPNA
jgi:CMP-N,N'-diacetyllegionaminic acid synthase